VRKTERAVSRSVLTPKLELPEKLIIYHAGTGRTTFLAMVKITTLFLGAFFCFIVAPSYIKADKPEWETASGMSLTPHLISPAMRYHMYHETLTQTSCPLRHRPHILCRLHNIPLCHSYPHPSPPIRPRLAHHP
jgi:hypothetical protein